MNKQELYRQRANEARELIKQGWSNNDIAVKLNMHHQNVCKLRKELGIPSPATAGRPRKPVSIIIHKKVNTNDIPMTTHKGYYKGRWISFEAKDITPAVVDCGLSSAFLFEEAY